MAACAMFSDHEHALGLKAKTMCHSVTTNIQNNYNVRAVAWYKTAREIVPCSTKQQGCQLT